MKKIYLFFAIVALAFSYASAQAGWTLNWWDGSNPFGKAAVTMTGKYSGQGIVFPGVVDKTAKITFDTPVTIPVGFKFKVVPTHWGDGENFYMTNKTVDVLPNQKISLTNDKSGGSDVTIKKELDNIVEIILEETEAPHQEIFITFVRKEVAPETSVKQYVIDFWSDDYQKFAPLGEIRERTTLDGKNTHHSLILQKQDNGTWTTTISDKPITIPAGKNMFAVVGLDNTDISHATREYWYQHGTVSASNNDYVLTTVANEGVDITNGLEHVSKIVVIPTETEDESTVKIRFEASSEVVKEQSDYWMNTWGETAIPNNTYFYKYNGILPDNIIVIYNANGFKVGADGQHFTIMSNGQGEFGGATDPTNISGDTPVELNNVTHAQMILEQGTYYRIYFNTQTKTFFALTSPKERVANTVEAFNQYSEGDIIRLNATCQTRYQIGASTVISSLKNSGSEYDVKAVNAKDYDQADWIKLDKNLAEGQYNTLFVRKGKNLGEASLIMSGIREDGEVRIDNTYSVYNFDQSWFTSNGYKEENVVNPRRFEKLVVEGYYYNDGQNDYCIGFPSQFNGDVKVPMTEQNILKVKLTGNISDLQSCFPNPANAPYYKFEGWFDGDAVNVTLSETLHTSVEDIESASKAVVIGGVGQISVLNAENVQVYTIGGALISNSAETQCAPGVYVVRADNSVVKVIVK